MIRGRAPRPRPAPALALAALTLGAAAGCGPRQEPPRRAFAFPSMGTLASCELALPADLPAPRAQALVQAAYDSVETRLSVWRPDSELSRLNRAPADSVVTASPLLARCLEAADDLRLDSGGAFDPTAGPLMDLWGFMRPLGRLPSPAEVDSVRGLVGRWRFAPRPPLLVKLDGAVRFDLGGIAKGLAVDIAVQQLRQAGVRDALIDLGGNLFCLGGAAGRRDWRVGIKDPLDKTRIFATVQVRDLALATSASYEKFVEIEGRRYGHVMNPATGRPAGELLSATAVAPSATLADGLSTALYVLGAEAGLDMLARRHPEVQAVLVAPGPAEGTARVLVTFGLRGNLRILPEYADRYVLQE